MALTRRALAQRIGWIAYSLAVPLGMVPGAERWSHLGGPWLADVASRHGIRTETGYFFGAAGAGFLALTVIPAAAGLAGYLVGTVVGLASGREPGPRPAFGREALAILGILPIWGLVLAPFSFLAVATLPLLRRLRARLGETRSIALTLCRVALFLLVAIQFWLLASWAPLLPNREVACCALVFVAFLASLRARARAHVPWVLAGAALLPGLVGPFAMPARWRVLSVLGHAAVLLPPWLIFRGRLVQESGRAVLACFVTFTLFWGRLAQTSFMPSSEPLAEPVVSAVFRGDEAHIRSGAFFLSQPCAGWPIVAGSKERERGLVVFPPDGGPAIASMRFMASDNYTADCASNAMYVADFMEARLYRLALAGAADEGPRLGPLRIEALPHRCDVHGPWWLALDRGRRSLYVLDEQNEIARADLETGECAIAVTGTKLWDFVIDDDRDQLIVGDSGRVRVVSKSDGRDLDSIDLPGRWRFILPAAHKTKVALSADGAVYAAYFNAGTVAKLARDPLRVVATHSLDRGVRLMLWDERRRVVYVGNRNTGALDALDGETLAVRGHVHVGRRMRTLSLTPDGRWLMLGSVVGGVRVDLDRLVGAAR